MEARTIVYDPIIVSRSDRFQITTHYQYDEDDGREYKGWWFTNVLEPEGRMFCSRSLYPGVWIKRADTITEAIENHLGILLQLMEAYPDDPEPGLELVEGLEGLALEIGARAEAIITPLDETAVVEAAQRILNGEQ